MGDFAFEWLAPSTIEGETYGSQMIFTRTIERQTC